ncbi:hypothetical protein [Massilia glaciei]|uniref:hypothetical protein n=1 Tax=Massilia glaciei TaxID=1524097 RepID=UPI0015E81E2D|nr:hypothetical protein [Massilia glaciei]
MSIKPPFPDPAKAPPLLNESDIGSGEKTPADKETEDIIRQIPPLPENKGEREAGAAWSDADADDADDAGGFDTGAARQRMEHDASLERDEPGAQLGELDPVPPKGR